MTKEDIKVYIENMIRPILSKPGDLAIDVMADELGVLYTLSANKADFGRIIGKQGGTINAIRTIVRIVGLTYGIRPSVKIPDPDREIKKYE